MPRSCTLIIRSVLEGFYLRDKNCRRVETMTLRLLRMDLRVLFASSLGRYRDEDRSRESIIAERGATDLLLGTTEDPCLVRVFGEHFRARALASSRMLASAVSSNCIMRHKVTCTYYKRALSKVRPPSPYSPLPRVIAVNVCPAEITRRSLDLYTSRVQCSTMNRGRRLPYFFSLLFH